MWRWPRRRHKTGSQPAQPTQCPLPATALTPDAGLPMVRYDAGQGEWVLWARLDAVPYDHERKPEPIGVPLGIREPSRLDAAFAEAARFLYGQLPPVADDLACAQQAGQGCGVFHERERGWRLWASCGECGGYALDLALSDPRRVGEAQAKAAAILTQRGCPGCVTLRYRRQPLELEYGCHLLWFDVDEQEWQLTLRLHPGHRQPITIGLGAGIDTTVDELMELARRYLDG